MTWMRMSVGCLTWAVSRGHVQKEEKRSFKCGMETNLVTDKKGPMEKGFLKTKKRVLCAALLCFTMIMMAFCIKPYGFSHGYIYLI